MGFPKSRKAHIGSRTVPGMSAQGWLAEQPEVRVEGAVRPASFLVARGSGKRRQLPDVAHVVLYMTVALRAAAICLKRS